MPTMNLLHTSPAMSRSTRLLGVAALLAGAAFGALAQYKIVGPDGQVTYTDKPPTASDVRIGNNSVPKDPGSGGIPYETRQAMARYPVTLYAAKGCNACDNVRTWLRGHAVPFNEVSLSTDNDYLALQARFGETLVPVTTIGGQTLKNYNSADLQSYIEAAGYPKQARLVGYNWPAPVPMTTPPRVAPATAAADPNATTADPAAQPAKPVPPPPSKNGIQF
jgi:glutaredoxin